MDRVSSQLRRSGAEGARVCQPAEKFWQGGHPREGSGGKAVPYQGHGEEKKFRIKDSDVRIGAKRVLSKDTACFQLNTLVSCAPLRVRHISNRSVFCFDS